MTVGVSCLVHAALIAGVLIAEQWTLDAHASRPPVLPAELVTLDEKKPEPPPPPPPKHVEPPKKVEAPKPPPKPTSLPKLIDAPMPKIAEATPEPEPRTVPAPEPPPAAPAAPAAAPAPSTPVPSAPAIAASPDPAPAAEPGPGPRSGRSAGLPGPAIASASPDGIPLGRAVGGTGQALASASGRDSGATGAITRAARPQGGYQVKPAYPASARRLGVQGTAMLRVHVLVDGRVGEVLVEQTAGHPDLDLAATDAVRRWRFDPARRGDEAVAMWVLLPVEFRLK